MGSRGNSCHEAPEPCRARPSESSEGGTSGDNQGFAFYWKLNTIKLSCSGKVNSRKLLLHISQLYQTLVWFDLWVETLVGSRGNSCHEAPTPAEQGHLTAARVVLGGTTKFLHTTGNSVETSFHAMARSTAESLCCTFHKYTRHLCGLTCGRKPF